MYRVLNLMCINIEKQFNTKLGFFFMKGLDVLKLPL